MGLSAPGIRVISGFLILMTVDTPGIIVMASLAVLLIVIELISMLCYPPGVVVIDPSVFMIEWHPVLFDVFVTDIAGNLFLSPFFVARNASAIHIRDKIRSDCVTCFNTRMALVTRYVILQMGLVGKF
jgi:hypothetical protein